MALAIINQIELQDEELRISGDIGVNNYFSIAFGYGIRLLNGIPILENPFFKTQLIGPIQERQMGKIYCVIPLTELRNTYSQNPQHELSQLRMQIASFIDESGNGLSVSDPVLIPINTLRISGATMTSNNLIPSQHDFVPGYFESKSLALTDCRCAPNSIQQFKYANSARTFHYRVSHPPTSRAMFLQQLLPLLPQVLPLIGQMITPGSTNKTQNTINIPNETASILQGLIKLLQPLLNQADNTLGPNNLSQEQSLRKFAVGMSNQVSRSFVAPALLAALPALMPLLQQVLNPENIKNVLEAPDKHIQTVFNGLKEFAKLGLESHEQDLQHLRALNPGVDDPALDQLMNSMSLSETKIYSQKPTHFKWVQSVALTIIHLQSQLVNGQTKWLYSLQGPIGFQYQVNTPKPIARGNIELEVTTLSNGEILFTQQIPINQVITPSQIISVFIQVEKLALLQSGEDYICTLRLKWKNSQQQWRGTSIQQTFTPIKNLIYDHASSGQQQFVLDNQQEYQGYWHELWSKMIDEPLKRTDVTLRYFLALKFENQFNTPLKTEFKIVEKDNLKVKAKARSGSDWSLSQLIQLTQHISQKSTISTEMVEALKSKDFLRRFNQAGEYTAKVRASDGDQIKIWVYPELVMTDIYFQKLISVNSFGQVTELRLQQTSLLLPVALYFKGVKISSKEQEMFLDKVNLFPIQLHDVDQLVLAQSKSHKIQSLKNKSVARENLNVTHSKSRVSTSKQHRQLGRGYSGGLSQRLKYV